MDKFNNQFATQKLRQEMSVTSTGAGMTPSTVNTPATQDWYTTKNKKKPKKEVKDVEPKLAAGKAKVYMKDKWGWEDAESIPNRPSEGGFIYSQIFEELSNFLKTNSQELARVEGLLAKARETKDYSVISEYENRIKILELLVYIEKKLGKQLPAISLGENFAEYLKTKLGYTGDIKVNKTGAVINLKDIADYIINSQAVVEDIDPDYEPEEQGDDEDSYDWFTNKNINEENDDVLDEVYVPDNIKRFAQRKGITSIVNQVARWAEKAGKRIVGGTAIGKNYSTLILDLTYQGSEVYINTDNDTIEVNGIEVEDYKSFVSALNTEETENNDEVNMAGEINESYSKFKNETKTRGKADQFHQAVRQVRQRVQEINRLFEYVNRLKLELSEGEGGLKYKIHTEKALAKIKEMVMELNQNIKKFK